jgi:hypothetical protein
MTCATSISLPICTSDIYGTYHESIVVTCCHRDRNQTLTDVLKHLANSLSPSWSIKLLRKLGRDIDCCTKLNHRP